MIESAIFALDGLWVDSKLYWEEACRQIAEEAGNHSDKVDHQATMEVSTQTWAEHMIRLELAPAPEDVQAKIVGKMLQLYSKAIPYLSRPIQAVEMASRHFSTGPDFQFSSGSHRHRDGQLSDARQIQGGRLL